MTWSNGVRYFPKSIFQRTYLESYHLENCTAGKLHSMGSYHLGKFLTTIKLLLKDPNIVLDMNGFNEVAFASCSDECRQACLDMPGCVLWMWISPQHPVPQVRKRCFMKSKVPNLVASISKLYFFSTKKYACKLFFQKIIITEINKF